MQSLIIIQSFMLFFSVDSNISSNSVIRLDNCMLFHQIMPSTAPRAQYSHRLVPSLQSNVRDQILAFRDETWNEYQNLLAKCTKEGLSLSVVSLAKGLLAPGDRRWEECTKHLRQMTGLQMVKSHKPDAG